MLLLIVSSHRYYRSQPFGKGKTHGQRCKLTEELLTENLASRKYWFINIEHSARNLSAVFSKSLIKLKKIYDSLPTLATSTTFFFFISFWSDTWLCYIIYFLCSNTVAHFEKRTEIISLLYLVGFFSSYHEFMSWWLSKHVLMWRKRKTNNDFSCSKCFPWHRKFDSKHTLKLFGHPLISVEQIYAEILKNRRKKLVTTNWRNSFLNNAFQIYTILTQSCLWCVTPKALTLLLQEKQNWALKADRHEPHLVSARPELTNKIPPTAAWIST